MLQRGDRERVQTVSVDTDVVVCPLSSSDASEFIEAVGKSRALHAGWVHAPDTQERFAAYLERSAQYDRAAFLIRHEPCGGLVGYANVNNIVRGAFQSAHLGYAAFTPHAGRGLMKKGLSQVLQRCFDELRLHRVEANVQPSNDRSLNLVNSLGFVKEGFSPRFLLVDGEWRDHERWAMRAENFHRQPVI